MGHLLAANKRDRAKLALKKKKLHEGQALQIERYILRLDEQVVALETTAQQVDTVDALRTANKAIKAMQKQIPLEEIENLMEESAEANAYMVGGIIQSYRLWQMLMSRFPSRQVSPWCITYRVTCRSKLTPC